MVVVKTTLRLVLPKVDLEYKIPDYRFLNDAGTAIHPNTKEIKTVSVEVSGANTATDTTAIPNVAQPLTDDQLKAEFLPEFLIDNNNVYALYPGENQYVYNHSIEINDFNTRHCQGLMYNESIRDLNINYEAFLNSDTLYDQNNLLYQLVCPRVSDNCFWDSTANDEPKRRRDQYFNTDTASFMQFAPPKIYIKGNPILDDGDSAITHWFQASVTWELEINFANLFIRHYIDKTKTRQHDIAFTKQYPVRATTSNFKIKNHKYTKMLLDNKSTHGAPTDDYRQGGNAVLAHHYNRRIDGAIKPCTSKIKVTPATAVMIL